jgi:Flp pilus assembly protein TadD
MNKGKLEEAYLTASAAVKIDDKRWEAYALRGMNLHAKGADKEATADLNKALLRAPEGKKATLHHILAGLSVSENKPAN